MSSRIGVDIGGTFTDLVHYDDQTGAILVEKVPTTPDNPEDGCVKAVNSAVPADLLSRAGYFLHGTTVGLNALLERRGAVVGLLVTEGFRDVLEIRRGSRDDMYNIFWTPPPPLVPRRLRLPVRERIRADAKVHRPFEAEDVIAALETFRDAGVTSIAVAFLNSYANPAHEIEAESVLRKAGFDGAISLSHRVSGEYRDYERTSTTVIDAFVRARLSQYLDHIEEYLRDDGFGGLCLVTRSGGGSMTFAESNERPFETIMSGPVAGAEGAAELSRTLGIKDLVSADVGGTSFDTCLILGGRPHILFQGSVAGMPVQAPWVDVRSIGAGGGSIADVDVGGLLQVGPRSAGAAPGPACYSRGGTDATVTDAAFYLGMLGEGRLASGVNLDLARAEAALAPLAEKLDYTVQQAARGIIAIAGANMANAMREITIEQGIDPRGLKLLAFGGAGPMMATQLARELSIREVIVPPHAGNFSAWGLLGADLLRSASRTRITKLSQHGLEQTNEVLRELFQGLEARDEGKTTEGAVIHEVGLDLRYDGQEHSVTIAPATKDGQIVATEAGVREMFRDIYNKSYGSNLDGGIEIVSVRAALRQPLPRRKEKRGYNSASDDGQPGARQAYSFARDEELDFALLDRGGLAAGKPLNGPAIIHEPTATTYVDADFSIEVDDSGCLRLIHEETTP